MNCLQGLRFGMNRVLHVFAKKKRRFAAAALASRSQMGFPACRPSCWVPADAGRPTQGLAGSRHYCFLPRPAYLDLLGRIADLSVSH